MFTVIYNLLSALFLADVYLIISFNFALWTFALFIFTLFLTLLFDYWERHK